MGSDGAAKPGRVIIAMAFVWGVVGFLIVASDPYTISTGAKAVLVWPVFVFITPPGWIALGWLWKWDPEANTPTFPTKPSNGPPPLWPPQTRDGEPIKPATPATALPHSDPSLNVLPVTNAPAPTSSNSSSSPQGSFVHTSNKPYSGPTNRPQPGAVFEGTMDQSSRRQLAARFGWICQLCLEKIPDLGWDYQDPHPRRLSVDHIIPLSRGGTDAMSNLQPVHAQCNTEKGDRLISNSEFRRWKSERDSPSRTTFTSRPSSTRSSSSRQWRGFGRIKNRPARPGKWSPGEEVVSDLFDDFDEANLSEEQRRRALEFLRADHPYPLMEKCQRGHIFTLENTYFSYDDEMKVRRQCRECRRKRKR